MLVRAAFVGIKDLQLTFRGNAPKANDRRRPFQIPFLDVDESLV
jgi:hypothetical protein